MTSKVVMNLMLSLDGYYEGPGGSLDWHYADDEHNEYAVKSMAEVGAILFGRHTYEIMAGYWPTIAPDDDPVKKPFNEAKKVVFSRTLKKAEWGGTVVMSELAQGIRKLKSEVKGDLLILGSPTLAQSALELGLLDRVELLLNPIFIGGGKSLFEGLRDPHRMRLVKTHARRSGVLELSYEPHR